MKPLFTLAVLLVAFPAAAEEAPAPAGQTRPSPYYLRDDVQFFPVGPESVLVAAETPAAADGDRYRLNLGIGFHDKVGLTVTLSFSDRDRQIDIRNVTLPMTLLVRPRANGLVAFAKWSLEKK
jgi:hypothetical protein